MRQILRSTAVVSGFNLATLLVSLVFQLVVAARFGTQAQMDAYLAASSLPSIILITVSGPVAFVLIPAFVRHRASGGNAASWQIASGFINLTALVLGVVAIGGILASRVLVHAVAPGLPPASAELAAGLSRILWPAVVFGGLTSVIVSGLQAEQRFAWPAFLPLAGSGLQVAIVLGLGRRFGVAGLAVAFLANNVTQFLLLVPSLMARGRYQPRAGWNAPAIRAIVYALIPVVLGRLCLDSSILLDRFFASRLTGGSIAQLHYANRIPTVLLSVFAAAFATTMFPNFAKLVAEDDDAGLRRTVHAATRYTWMVYCPVVVILSVLARPVVEVVLERGAFRPADSAAVAAILPWFLAAMLGGALRTISSRLLYALNEPRLMAALNAATAVVYAATAMLLVPRYGLLGVAITAAFTSWFAYVSQSIAGFMKMRDLVEPRIFSAVGRTIIAALAGGAGSLWLRHSSALSGLVPLTAFAVIGFATYALVLILLNVPGIMPRSLRDQLVWKTLV